MNEIKTQPNLEEHQEIFRRLAHFTAPSMIGVSKLSESILDNLVEHILYLENQAITIDKIPSLIKNHFRLFFDFDEVKTSLERLISKKIVVKSLKGGGISLEAHHRSGLQKLVKQKAEHEHEIIEKLAKRIKNTYTHLTPENIDQIKFDFQKFLTTFFLLAGAEAVQLIYGNPKEITELLAKIQKRNIFDLLLQRPSNLREIEKKEFIDFVNLLSDQEKTYLQDLLDKSLQYFTITVDKNCEALLVREFKGWDLFIDTNFLYNLLGLNRDSIRLRKKSAEQILELGKKVNIKFFVSPMTLEEFTISVSKARELLLGDQISRKLYKIAGDIMGNSILSAYSSAYEQHRISPKDFLVKIENIKDVLKSYGIEEKTDYSQSIKNTRDFNETLKKMIAITGKEQHVAEHDTFHYLLILKLRTREGAGTTFWTNKSWFLTYDSLLAPFDFEIRKSEIPFCIRTYQLRQILRPLFSRTDDFESVFIDFVIEPIGRAFPAVSADIAINILARVTYFEKELKVKESPELATKILTNQYFMNQLRELRTDESEQVQLIDQKIKQVAGIQTIEPNKEISPPIAVVVNYWNYINPFWLLWQLLKMIWAVIGHIIDSVKKHRILSVGSVFIVILGLLAIDYSLAWRNVKVAWDFIVKFLQ